MANSKNIFINPRKLYNIDVVGAKSGKSLTKFEKFLNFTVNAFCAWGTYAVGIFFLIILVIICWEIGGAIFDFLGENPIYIIPIVLWAIVRPIYKDQMERKRFDDLVANPTYDKIYNLPRSIRKNFENDYLNYAKGLKKDDEVIGSEDFFNDEKYQNKIKKILEVLLLHKRISSKEINIMKQKPW